MSGPSCDVPDFAAIARAVGASGVYPEWDDADCATCSGFGWYYASQDDASVNVKTFCSHGEDA